MKLSESKAQSMGLILIMIFFISMKVFLFEACHHLQDLFFFQFLLNPQGKAGGKKKKKSKASGDSYNPNPITRKTTGRGHHTGQFGARQVMSREVRLRNCHRPQDTGDRWPLHVGAWMGSWNRKGTAMGERVESE